MNQANLQTDVRMDNQVGIIDITGDVNGAAEEPLMQALQSVSRQGAREILLNFSGLATMNSSGIGLLVTLLIRANRSRQKLLACGLSQHYRDIFRLMRLDEAITLFATEAEALARARAQL